MLQDFLKSFENTDLSKLSLKNLVKLEKTLSLYEATTPLRFYRNKINQEYLIRAKKIHDLREQVHEINTGYKPEDWSDWEDESLSPEQKSKLNKRAAAWDDNFGWKIHLDVVPNRNHPVTREISDFLIEFGVSHKIAHGGDNGKGMTIYVGSYNDVCKLANLIQNKFGSKIFVPPIYTDQKKQEHMFTPTVYGRFVVSVFAGYPSSNIAGISVLRGRDGFSFDQLGYFGKTIRKAEELSNLDTAEFLNSVGIKWTKETTILATYLSHKLYAAVYGKYYYGENLQQFEKAFLENKIPAKGTKERKEWDEIADVFVEEAKEKGLFEIFKNKIKGYVPLNLIDKETVNNIRSKWKQNKQTQDYKEMASGIISKMKREI